MKNNLQFMIIKILNSKYKIIINLFVYIILKTFYVTDAFVLCSTEAKEEYIKFLEEECSQADNKINYFERTVSSLEKKISELEQHITELKHTITEQKTVIEEQKTLLAKKK